MKEVMNIIFLDEWDIYEVTCSSSDVNVYWNDTLTWSVSSTSYVPDESLCPIVGGARGSNYASASTYAYWDWILVRKFVENEPTHGAWGSEEGYLHAFLIWGTPVYPYDEIYDNDTEQELSEAVCYDIYERILGTHQYDIYFENFWGDDTQSESVYSNVSYCDSTFNYTAIFYKGHTTSYYDCTCGNKHHRIYGLSGADLIWDNATFDEMSSFNHDFVFLWTCVVGAQNETGGLGGVHSWGMQASWMGRTDLNFDGYDDPDNTNHVFISFENISIPFVYTTGYDNYDYGDFATQFFFWALYNENTTINDALDLATDDTHQAASFLFCPLYTGYYMANPQAGVLGQPDFLLSYMRVYGDGNHVLPN
ncbi:MAG: hypothetical protein WC325_06595 [Candidatus Bathyarchaeia archaeon]